MKAGLKKPIHVFCAPDCYRHCYLRFVVTGAGPLTLLPNQDERCPWR